MGTDRAREIGERLRERREALGLTQEEVARRCESPRITGNVVSRWERGRNRPSASNLEEVAGALGLDVSYLLFGRASAAAAHDGEVVDQLRGINERLGELVELARVRSAPEVGEIVALALRTLGVDPQALPRSEPESLPPAASAPRSRRSRT